jgi:hypothetical protein
MIFTTPRGFGRVGHQSFGFDGDLATMATFLEIARYFSIFRVPRTLADPVESPRSLADRRGKQPPSPIRTPLPAKSSPMRRGAGDRGIDCKAVDRRPACTDLSGSIISQT